MIGGRSGWFNESWRHSLAAKGVSTNHYFVRKARRITLDESNRYRSFRGDLIGERDRLREEARDLKELARESQARKAGASKEERAVLEAARAEAMEKRLEVKGLLREVNQKIEQAYEAGELDPVEKKRLLEEDRESTKRRAERAEEQQLLGKARATRERGLVLLERAAIDRERRKLGLPRIRSDAEEAEFERMFGQFPSSGRSTEKIRLKKEEKAVRDERARERKEFLEALPETERKFRRDVEAVGALGRKGEAEKAFEDVGLEVVDVPEKE